jgi:hypothetical protein
MDRRQRGELFLERPPHGEGIQKDVFAVERGHEKLGPEGFLDLGAEDARDLETALLIDTSRSAPAKAIHSNLRTDPKIVATFSHFLPI